MLMGIICFIESGYEIKLLSAWNAIKVVYTNFGRGRNCVQLFVPSINKISV
jgi:hypothetical protein